MFITLCSPNLLGIYKDGVLIEKYQDDELKASDFLETYYVKALQKYTPNELIYANGPGSFMGMKLAYVFLKTISIVKNIPLYAVGGFDVNDSGKIKANKMFCFKKNEHGKIIMSKEDAGMFFLPKILPDKNEDNLPFYFLPALN